MFKRIVTAGVLTVSALGVMAANATTPGFYATGQLGYAYTHLKDKLNPLSNNKVKIDNGALAGRLGVGYQLNQNLAVELGYLQLANQNVKGLVGVNSVKVKQHAFDVAAKGILPINDKFNAYAKLGVAYLTTTAKGTSTPVFLYKTASGTSDTHHNWAPEVGLGVSYNFTPNVFVDTSWTHIHPTGKNKPGNIDFAAVGIGYSFG